MEAVTITLSRVSRVEVSRPTVQTGCAVEQV